MKTLTLSILFCCLSLPVTAAEKARIAVASNFTAAMQQLVQQFERQTSYRVIASYGSTGKLFAQITNGAPFDAFLAADSARPRRLEGLGLIAAGSRFTYARGEIALWSPLAKSDNDVLDMLKAGSFRYLALANPRTAPYGAAAEEVLTRLGLDKRFSKQKVRGENIAQTYQFVHSGNAELGFVSKSQLALAGEASPGAVWRIPTDMYTPIEQQAVLLKRAEGNPAAQAFMAFLQSEAAIKTILANGYGTADVQLAKEAPVTHVSVVSAKLGCCQK